jgi:hypothetical protein
MFRKLKPEAYIEMSKELGTYARGVGCSQIIAYISNDKLKKILENSGANVVYTLVVFPLVNF